MTRSLATLALTSVVLATSGCARKPVEDYRGSGLSVENLSLNDRLSVYQAVVGAAFRSDTLFVLADRTLLPRREGLLGGDPVRSDVIGGLLQYGIVQGTCQVPVREIRVPLVCQAERTGYAARFSEPFKLGADSVQVHLVAQNYVVPGSPRVEPVRFERAYQVAKQEGVWKTVREAEMAKP